MQPACVQDLTGTAAQHKQQLEQGGAECTAVIHLLMWCCSKQLQSEVEGVFVQHAYIADQSLVAEPANHLAGDRLDGWGMLQATACAGMEPVDAQADGS